MPPSPPRWRGRSPTPSDVTRYVYAETRPDGSPELPLVGGLAPAGHRFPPGSEVARPEPARINLLTAIRRTLEHELATNPQDAAVRRGRGPQGWRARRHDGAAGRPSASKRVFDTSLSEEGIIGRAVGMALAGLMPVAEIQFRKYADPATEQLNNCGTMRWRTHNRFAAPIVVRMPGGYAPKCGDPWHSVCGEVLWAHATGWQVCIPSNAEDAVGLLRAALRSNNPTIFFEHRALLDGAWARRPYPGDDFVLPLGKARVVLDGDKLTVVTWGAMVERCERAARELGQSIEVLDLRTVAPWDREAVLASVRKTRRCLIVHEDTLTAGFGAEVAAVVAEEAFLSLDAPISRLAIPDVPTPYNVATDERGASQRRGDRGQDAGTDRVLAVEESGMAELIAIAAPADQAEGTEMVVGTWFKHVGESVTQNEPLLEITTDKVTVEIAAPATGILREILKPTDQPIQAGEVLGRIEVGAAAAGRARSGARRPTSTGEPASTTAELTPAVRRLLTEHGLEASAISGTGRGGRITVQDVEAHIASRPTAHPPTPSRAPIPAGRCPTPRCAAASPSTWCRASRSRRTSPRSSRPISPRSSLTVRPTALPSRRTGSSSPTPPISSAPAWPRCRPCRRSTAAGTTTRWSCSTTATSGSRPRSRRAASSCPSSTAPRRSTCAPPLSGCRI